MSGVHSTSHPNPYSLRAAEVTVQAGTDFSWRLIRRAVKGMIKIGLARKGVTGRETLPPVDKPQRG